MNPTISLSSDEDQRLYAGGSIKAHVKFLQDNKGANVFIRDQGVYYFNIVSTRQ